MAEPIVMECPGCSQKYKVPTDRLGKQVQCQKCGARFTLGNDQAVVPVGIPQQMSAGNSSKSPVKNDSKPAIPQVTAESPSTASRTANNPFMQFCSSYR